MNFFAQLGSQLSRRWSELHHEHAVFPQLASAALTDARPHEHVVGSDILRWFASAQPLPRQRDIEATFGEPPITLYHDEHLSIAALYWVDGTTAIHQHGFGGAFTVLDGSSIQTAYEFTRDEAVNEQLVLGSLERRNVELLGPGDVRPILADSDLIHSVFHLDRPTVSLVVRTHLHPRGGPQLAYLHPGIGYDPFHSTERSKRTRQVAEMMLRVGDPNVGPFMEEVLRRGTLLDSVPLIRLLARYEAGASIIGRCIDTIVERHQRFGDRLMGAFQEQRRQYAILERRRHLHDSDRRYLLALLLCVSGRSQILELVKARYVSKDPVDVLMGWIGSLRTQELEGTGHGILGVPLEDPDLWVVERLLRGHREAELLEELAKKGDDVANLTPGRVQKLCFMLPFTSIFRPLLAD